jgi:hypothetical protein
VDGGDEVTLSAAGSSDLDGDDLTYTWTQVQGPTVALSDPSAVEPTFTAPEDEGTVVFSLTVSDGETEHADLVSVEIQASGVDEPPDSEPVVAIDAPATAEEGSRVSMTSSATDPEGGALTYRWVQTDGPAVSLDDPTAAAVSFDAPEGLANSNVTFELEVSDGVNTTVEAVTITVQADDDAPTAEAGDDLSVEEGATVRLDGSGSDVEGQDLTYEWVQTGGPAVTLDGADTSSPSFDAPEGLVNADVTFELRVSDGVNTTADTVTVTVNADDDAPTADAGAAQRAEEGGTVQLAGSGQDPEGRDLTYEWVQTGGPDVVLSDATAPDATFEVPELRASDEVTFELRVSDGVNTTVDTVRIELEADDGGPTVSAGDDLVVEEGDAVRLAGAGSDPEGSAVTYEWVQTGGPAVVLSDPCAAEPEFEAPEGVANTDLEFELRVSDGVNTSVDTVTVTVQADDDAPTAEAGDDLSVEEGDPVRLAGSGSDVEGQDLTHQWVQVGGPAVELAGADSLEPTFEAPEGLANTELVFELRVSDGTSTSVDTVAVHVAADDDAPTADAGTPRSVVGGTTVQLQGSGSDPEGGGLTYEWAQTGGPRVFLSDADSPSPVFLAPDGADPSRVSFELRVSDGTSTSVSTVWVDVLPPDGGDLVGDPDEQGGVDDTRGDLDAIEPALPSERPPAQDLSRMFGDLVELPQVVGSGVGIPSPDLFELPEAQEGLSFAELFVEVDGASDQATRRASLEEAADHVIDVAGLQAAEAEGLAPEGDDVTDVVTRGGLLGVLWNLLRASAGTTDTSERRERSGR